MHEILADYDHDSVVILNDEIYRGRDAITKVYTKLFNAFDKVLDSKIYRITIEKGSIYLLWNAKVQRENETTYSGTDTFLIEKGRIKLQTITVDEAFFK